MLSVNVLLCRSSGAKFEPMKALMIIFASISLFFSFNSAQADFKPPAQWEEWVKESKERFQEKFAAPTITHHVYLEKVGDQAFLKTGGSYPRWVLSQCKSCQWKIELLKDKKLRLVSLTDTKKTEDLPMKKETSLPGSSKIFIAPMAYEGDPRIRVFIHDLRQEKLNKKREREFFKYNAGYVMMGKWKWLQKSKDITIQRSDGSQKKIQVIGEIHYEMKGGKEKGKLSVYNFSESDSYKENKATMLLYRDYSNGKQTYGAGRFLNVYFDKKIAELKDGSLVKLDFNYSYNPPCAVSTGFHCPLPQDTVKLKVLAGEKYNKI